MRVWEYIRGKTCGYGDRKVIAGRSMTYRDLPDYTEKPDRRLRLCQGTTRAELAEAVIRCLAEGDIAVPVSKEYGEKQYAYIRSVIEGAGQGSAELKDVAMIVFTSGTTGKPKGVMLTDENIIENLEYISEYFDVRGLERLCISRSLTHISALTGELLYGICRGMTIAFYEGIFVPLRLLCFLRDNQAEVYCATPTIFGNLARYAEIRSFPVKAAAISGERLTEKQARKIAGAFPDTKFYNVYGLTEHSPRASALLPEDFVRKAGSIGKPIGRTEMRIEEGELLLRSPCVMKGYYADGERTAEKLKGGWLHTGDMAHRDEEGYYYIDGRKDDMIIRAGVKIFPGEIEEVLKMCPGVEECRVYGEADERFGEKICAEVKGEAKPADIRRFAVKNLPPHLQPNEYKKTEAFEYTAGGKLVRRKR
mgnify:FL=1